MSTPANTAVCTVDRLPDGVEADADKDDQGLAEQVDTVALCDVAKGRSGGARA